MSFVAVRLFNATSNQSTDYKKQVIAYMESFLTYEELESLTENEIFTKGLIKIQNDYIEFMKTIPDEREFHALITMPGQSSEVAFDQSFKITDKRILLKELDASNVLHSSLFDEGTILHHDGKIIGKTIVNPTCAICFEDLSEMKEGDVYHCPKCHCRCCMECFKDWFKEENGFKCPGDCHETVCQSCMPCAELMEYERKQYSLSDKIKDFSKVESTLQELHTACRFMAFLTHFDSGRRCNFTAEFFNDMLKDLITERTSVKFTTVAEFVDNFYTKAAGLSEGNMLCIGVYQNIERSSIKTPVFMPLIDASFKLEVLLAIIAAVSTIKDAHTMLVLKQEGVVDLTKFKYHPAPKLSLQEKAFIEMNRHSINEIKLRTDIPTTAIRYINRTIDNFIAMTVNFPLKTASVEFFNELYKLINDLLKKLSFDIEAITATFAVFADDTKRKFLEDFTAYYDTSTCWFDKKISNVTNYCKAENDMRGMDDMRLNDMKTLLKYYWIANFNEKLHSHVGRCSNRGCDGFVTSERRCTKCGKFTCERCNVCCNQLESHECKKEDVETWASIVANTKACPWCFNRIEKAHGCDDMFCNACHKMFNWHTGEKIYGQRHNPEAVDFQRGQGIFRRFGVDVSESTITRAFRRLCSTKVHEDFLENVRIFYKLEEGLTEARNSNANIEEGLNSAFFYITAINLIDPQREARQKTNLFKPYKRFINGIESFTKACDFKGRTNNPERRKQLIIRAFQDIEFITKMFENRKESMYAMLKAIEIMIIRGEIDLSNSTVVDFCMRSFNHDIMSIISVYKRLEGK